MLKEICKEGLSVSAKSEEEEKLLVEIFRLIPIEMRLDLTDNNDIGFGLVTGRYNRTALLVKCIAD